MAVSSFVQVNNVCKELRIRVRRIPRPLTAIPDIDVLKVVWVFANESLISRLEYVAIKGSTWAGSRALWQAI